MRLLTRDRYQATPQYSVRCLACKYCVILRTDAQNALTTRLADGGNDNLLWDLMRLIMVPAWMDGTSFLYTSHKISTCKAVIPGKVRVSSAFQISLQQGKDDIFLS